MAILRESRVRRGRAECTSATTAAGKSPHSLLHALPPLPNPDQFRGELDQYNKGIEERRKRILDELKNRRIACATRLNVHKEGIRVEAATLVRLDRAIESASNSGVPPARRSRRAPEQQKTAFMIPEDEDDSEYEDDSFVVESSWSEDSEAEYQPKRNRQESLSESISTTSNSETKSRYYTPPQQLEDDSSGSEWMPPRKRQRRCRHRSRARGSSSRTSPEAPPNPLTSIRAHYEIEETPPRVVLDIRSTSPIYRLNESYARSIIREYL